MVTFKALESAAQETLSRVAFGIDVFAAGILIVAAAWALYQVARAIPAGELEARLREIRLRFGRALVLSLEFLVAADILRSIVAPSLQALQRLALIVILRTILSVAIEWEMREIRRKTGKHVHEWHPE